MKSLACRFVLFAYFTVFSAARFAYKLYGLGHDLDPKAPFDVEPFMPPLLGTQQIANFTTSSYPMTGSLYLGIFAVGLLVALVLSLGRRDPAR